MKKVLLLLGFVLLAGVLSFADDLGEMTSEYYERTSEGFAFEYVPIIDISSHLSLINNEGDQCYDSKAKLGYIIFERTNKYRFEIEFANPKDEDYDGRVLLLAKGWDHTEKVLFEQDIFIKAHGRKRVKFTISYEDIKEFDNPKMHHMYFYYYDKSQADIRGEYREGWVRPGNMESGFGFYVGAENYVRDRNELNRLIENTKEDFRKKEELKHIEETSSVTPNDYGDYTDDNGIKRKLYYNPSLFPHYHQTKHVATKPDYHFDMPWDLVNNKCDMMIGTVPFWEFGCYVTSVLNVIQGLGRGANPRYVNHYMKNNNKYTSNGSATQEGILGYLGNYSDIIAVGKPDIKPIGYFKDELFRISENQSDFKVAMLQVGNHRVIVYGWDESLLNNDPDVDSSVTWDKFYINDSSFHI